MSSNLIYSPHTVNQPSPPGDARLHSLGKLYPVLVIVFRHARKVPDVGDESPRRHHAEQIQEHAVARGIPKRVAEPWIVLEY